MPISGVKIPPLLKKKSINDECTIADAEVAQLVEQRTENPRVSGSIPDLGTVGVKVSKHKERV